MREKGLRCDTLSEYVKEVRTPDAIVFDGMGLIAVEIEQRKRYKASDEAIARKLSELNSRAGFFDRTEVIFIEGQDLNENVVKSIQAIIKKA